jgi:hypothetical protein
MQGFLPFGYGFGFGGGPHVGFRLGSGFGGHGVVPFFIGALACGYGRCFRCLSHIPFFIRTLPFNLGQGLLFFGNRLSGSPLVGILLRRLPPIHGNAGSANCQQQYKSQSYG